MPTNGVVYYNRGGKCIPRLIVSLMTLRRHYQGAVTIYLEGEHPQELVDNLKSIFKADIVYRPKIEFTTGTLVHKIEISMESPYDVNVWLDSDTVILGEFSELFNEAAVEGRDLVIPHFAGWSTKGGTIRRRIERYRKFCPEYIDDAVKYGPAINTGVYAWPRTSKMFDEWLRVAKWGDDKMFIADEVACQTIMPRFNCKVVGTKYNVSVLHDPNTQDPRIIHYHGKKHCKEAPKCAFWLQAFLEACQTDLCGIRKYIDRSYGDKRLNNFLAGKGVKMHEAIRKEIVRVLANPPVKTPDEAPKPVEKPAAPEIPAVSQPTIVPAASAAAAVAPLSARIARPPSNGQGISPSEVTIVTACDGKYVEHLAATLPNWIKYKKIDQYQMIVYVNGFGHRRRDHRLDFLRRMPNVRLISWEFPEAQSQRERMLTAFVLGTAKDVVTPFWMKIDADAYATDYSPIITPDMRPYAIVGHKWGYSKVNVFQPLIEWSNNHPAFDDFPKDVFDPKLASGRRYTHSRVASYVMLHNSEFVRFAAELAGKRLPTPSHDTYVWYVAHRLGMPYKRHNFKRASGMTNKSELGALKARLAEVEQRNAK